MKQFQIYYRYRFNSQDMILIQKCTFSDTTKIHRFVKLRAELFKWQDLINVSKSTSHFI